MVEAMIAGMVLAVAAFGVAQALGFGLKTTGIARQRAGAEALANQQLERARALNYDNVVLRSVDDAGNPIAITHDGDPESPDYWVTDGTPPLYDPDGDGPLALEPILADDLTPYLLHYQAAVTQGNTSFTIYTYVTWVDSPTDGLVPNDVAHDWDGDGILDDPDGHDMKRVTVVITWPNSFGTAVHELKMSSLFSLGNIAYQDAESLVNQPPSVNCPASSVNGATANFTVGAGDVDGTVVRIDWDFGDGTVIEGGGVTQNHTYLEANEYTVINTVYDDDGASATTAGMGCTVVIEDVSPPPVPEEGAPSCGISIENGATYATTEQVTLYLTSEPMPATMQFYSPPDTVFGAELPFDSTTLFGLPTGDGVKTVFARFTSPDGASSLPCSDTIILDMTTPGPPLYLVISREANKKTATLQWQPPSPTPLDLAGYQVWRRATTAQVFTQIQCAYTGPVTCIDQNLDQQTNYEYYVVAIDLAGNQSVESNHRTV